MARDDSLVLPASASSQDILRAAEVTSSSSTLDRRSFLKFTGLISGGLVLAFYVGDPSAELPDAKDAALAPNGFLRISPDGTITLYSKTPEIGQGIKTAFPMIIAEELDADWAHVRVEQAAINPAVYGRQSAGGSRSIATSWDQLRRAGAVGRAMLISAAAKQWNVSEADCTTASSVVFHRASHRQATYGSLATIASALPVPDEKTLKLKSPNEYRLLGKRVGGVDNQAIVTGQPLFGIDQVVPGMQYAVFVKCPAVGGTVKAANLEEVRKLPGVTQAFIVSGTGKPTEVMPGVAIVATSTWGAFSARNKLRVTWDETTASKDSWTAYVEQAKKLAPQAGLDSLRNTGNVDKVFADSKPIEAFYSYPFIAHAPLEPQNSTASFKDGAVEIWSPTQNPDAGVELVAGVLGIASEKVTLHQTRVGGGFGRRLMNDYMCEAAVISKQAGVPVKLQWTREDDMHHDFFRVGGFHSFKASLDSSGKLLAWQDHFITFTQDGITPTRGGDMSPDEFPAQLVPNVRLTQTKLKLQLPTGPWRAPRSCSIAFATQSFLHECAVRANRDHLEFLLDLLGEPRWLDHGNEFALDTGRAAGVVKLAAQKAGWGQQLPKGRGMGLAFHFSHAGHFAEVADVSVDANRKLTVHRIVAVGDIGPVINMSSAENQVEGAVIDGFSAAMGQEIGFENGRVLQNNFHDYPLLRIGNAPNVKPYFIQSAFPPTGVGEPALPPVAPAITNAIFAATGHRVRTLPLTKEGFTV